MDDVNINLYRVNCICIAHTKVYSTLPLHQSSHETVELEDYLWCTGRVTKPEFFPGSIRYGRCRDGRGNSDASGAVALYPGRPTGASDQNTSVCPFIKAIVTAVLLPTAGEVQVLLCCIHRGHFRPLQSEKKERKKLIYSKGV